MKSIEALERIEIVMPMSTTLFYKDFDLVRKDLEILEILKQYIIYKDYGNDMESYVLNKTIHKANYSYGEGWEKELEEFNKIKEWLEDAKS